MSEGDLIVAVALFVWWLAVVIVLAIRIRRELNRAGSLVP